MEASLAAAASRRSPISTGVRPAAASRECLGLERPGNHPSGKLEPAGLFLEDDLFAVIGKSRSRKREQKQKSEHNNPHGRLLLSSEHLGCQIRSFGLWG
jgi:hypothetical protein